MPYSLEVLVINQNEYTDIPFNSTLKLEWEGGRLGKLRLKKTWPIMSSMPGIWYNILKKDEVYFENTSLIFETDFENLITQSTYYWINEERRKEFFTPFIIRDNYFDEVKQILNFLISQSPIKTIMILPLSEKGKIETIQGPIPFTHYFELIKQRKIPFNVSTIVKNDL